MGLINYYGCIIDYHLGKEMLLLIPLVIKQGNIEWIEGLECERITKIEKDLCQNRSGS